MKKLLCLALALLLAGCIPIGLKSQSLPLTSTLPAPGAQPLPDAGSPFARAPFRQGMYK